MSVGAPHRIAFTDWGPIGSGVPVIPASRARDVILISSPQNWLVVAAAYCVLISLVADGAAGS